MKIYDVCTEGSDEECKQITYTEGGRLSGSVTGGTMGAYAGALICGVTAATTMGAGGVACAIILGGTGSALGGSIGGDAGEFAGQEMYRYVEDE